MSIDNKYWCGGYKKWLKFSQEGQGLDKAQNCELAKKAKSEYGETLKWQIRKSENKKITIDELKNFGKKDSKLGGHPDRNKIKNDLKTGEVNIVIGTHALLSNDVDFNNLGLLIIDEEQHFGVAQKEKIKELQGNIHVLTLSATPIPRTLQLSLSGLKQLSLITTPPVNRLSIRTFVLEWDKVVLLDALNREKNRIIELKLTQP